MAFLSRRELRALSTMRKDDALVLLQNRRYSAAYYLAGYAVGIGLKACISRVFDGDVFPDKNFVNSIYTHNLDNLVGLANLKADLREITKAQPIFASYWGVVANWSEESRYQVIDQINASAMVQSIADDENGVHQWIAKHW